MKKILTTFAIGLLILNSCETKKDTTLSSASGTKDTIATDTNNSKSTLDWVGTYTGTIPCADCKGIKTTVTLHKDQTIKIESVYLKNNEKLVDEGRFQWTADNNALYLETKNKDRYFYKVKDNKLIVLNQEGAEITDESAKDYILQKTM